MQLISNRINGIDYFPFFSMHAIENHVLFPIGSRLFGKDDFFLIIQTPVLYRTGIQTYENSNFYLNSNLNQEHLFTCLPC